MGVICALGCCYHESLLDGQHNVSFAELQRKLDIILPVFRTFGFFSAQSSFPHISVWLCASVCVCAAVCGWLCQARRWQGVGRGLWTWLLCLAPPVTESEGDITRPQPPQPGQSGASACGWISACLLPRAALWHTSPYGFSYAFLSGSCVCFGSDNEGDSLTAPAICR